MYKEISFTEAAQSLLQQLQIGAFLVASDERHRNPMTIAWGTLGYMWNQPVFMVMVRYTRYTYELMEKNPMFTVSVPLHGQLKRALALCGTRSGRDLDKADACDLTFSQGSQRGLYYIEDCDLHVECETIYRQAMEPASLNIQIKQQHYSTHDFHVLYYGKILRVFRKENE
ncbi:MAG: flavin reductase [Bacillota bacterium]|nr:flavin reductase [Bacillota bacterium]MDW7676123.1 flavin reductase [Bacillota bacterium]